MRIGYNSQKYMMDLKYRIPTYVAWQGYREFDCGFFTSYVTGELPER
jgi:hypothetical protein